MQKTFDKQFQFSSHGVYLIAKGIRPTLQSYLYTIIDIVMPRDIKYFVTRKKLFYDDKLLKTKETITTRLREYHNTQYCDIKYNPGRYFPYAGFLRLAQFLRLILKPQCQYSGLFVFKYLSR